MAAETESAALRPASRWRTPALLAAAALAASAYFGRNLILGTPVEVLEVVRADLVQTVVANSRH